MEVDHGHDRPDRINATEDEITIYLDETLTIGTVQTASTFLFDIIGDNVGGFELMEYRPQDKAFVIPPKPSTLS